MIPVTPIQADTPSQMARQISDRLGSAIQTHLLQAFAPDNTKTMRAIPASEAAELIGASPAFMRKCHGDGTLPEPTEIRGGRRYYTAEELWQARITLEKGSKTPGKYLPWRGAGEPLQVWQLMNFKGGSSKSTTSIHLAHYLCLHGYRVLMVDLDPQGSLTGMCGLDPKTEFDGLTVYDAIKYDNPAPMSDIIVDTYLPGLSLAPARLVLSEFDTESALNRNAGPTFYSRLRNAIEQVEDRFDVVLIDSPPQLSFLTLTGMSAATSIIVPLTPSMMDVTSTTQFIELAAAYMEVIEKHGAQLHYDHFKFLITRDEPTDVPSQQLVSFMRALLQDQVMSSTSFKSTAVSDATMMKQSIYEVSRSDMTRGTYDRARQSMDSVGSEVAQMIKQAWGRS